MKPDVLSAMRKISRQQWSALGLSLGLGGLLVAVLFAGLRPGSAAAAEAAVYSCDPAGLNLALATGGSATFSCGAPTTVTITSRKVVAQNVRLDGGSNLILSGGNVTGVFTVAAGVHLSLLNLTVRDANVHDYGGGVANYGVLNVTNSHFISNSAAAGAAIFNAPGASAVISAGTFEENLSEGGAILNGDNHFSATASLAVINSGFIYNKASGGAAIYNLNGPVTVTGSAFYFNIANSGGAIYDLSHLRVDQSQFFVNGAFVFAPLGQQPSFQQPSGSTLLGGGAIGIASTADVIIAGSAFTGNFGSQAGGAILFGTLPLDSNVTLSPGGLTIVNSRFDSNCTTGAGGALSSSETTTVTDSSFSQNGALANGCAFPADQAAALSKLPAAPSAPTGILPSGLSGAGGAIFNDGPLNIAGGVFISNSASVTTTGGGGAIANWSGASLQAANSSFVGNSAWQDGGAIFNNFGALASVLGSDFTYNRVLSDSGGAVANLGEFTATYSSFTHNGGAPSNGFLGGGGGAIFSNNGALLVAGTSASNGPGPGDANPPPEAPLILPVNHLTLDHSTFISNWSEFEGGALDTGAATIVASTFTSNTARFGGAIDILSNNVTVSASTFTANAVQGSSAQGGAIDTFSSGMTNINVINSTFFGNLAATGAVGGAINGDNGALAITNSTFLSNTAVDSGSGGAFSGNGNFVVTNTLLAYNVGGACQVSMTLGVGNLEYPGAFCAGTGLHVDPLALAPANNGGPTLTSALLPASPAINAGQDGPCPGTDQRGASRPVGAHCDIGAFEFGGQVPWLWLPLVRE